jgi:hypothetical protein
MVSPGQSPLPPFVPPVGVPEEDQEDYGTGPTVGASDADADAARAGADVDLAGATHDSDGVPVGRADAEADAERAAADPDA